MSTPGQPGQHPEQQGPYPGQGPPAAGPPGHAPGQQGGGLTPPQPPHPPHPPQPPQKKKSSPLPWVLGGCGLALVLLIGVVGVGSYFVFFPRGGSGDGSAQGSPTPQAQPRYTGIPFHPCEEISAAAVSNAVPDAEPTSTDNVHHPTSPSSTCAWETPSIPDIDFSATLEIQFTALLNNGVELARQATKPDERDQSDPTVRRLPNLGDVAYSWKAASVMSEAVVEFSTSNLIVKVTYSKNSDAGIGKKGNYPYKELHRVALTWAKRMEQRV